MGHNLSRPFQHPWGRIQFIKRPHYITKREECIQDLGIIIRFLKVSISAPRRLREPEEGGTEFRET